MSIPPANCRHTQARTHAVARSMSSVGWVGCRSSQRAAQLRDFVAILPTVLSTFAVASEPDNKSPPPKRRCVRLLRVLRDARIPAATMDLVLAGRSASGSDMVVVGGCSGFVARAALSPS